LRLTNLFSRIKFLSIPLHTEGRFAIVTMRGAGCGGRARCSIAGPARNFRPRTDRAAKAMTTTPRADGPSRRSWRDASRQAAAGKAGSFFRGDGRRRKSAISVGNNGSPTGGCPKQAVKTTACGTPDASGAAVVTTLVCSPTHTHTRLRTHRASGVPRALFGRAGMQKGFRRPRAVNNRGDDACLSKTCMKLFDNQIGMAGERDSDNTGSLSVIASEAKQSSPNAPQTKSWIASSLRSSQ